MLFLIFFKNPNVNCRLFWVCVSKWLIIDDKTPFLSGSLLQILFHMYEFWPHSQKQKVTCWFFYTYAYDLLICMQHLHMGQELTEKYFTNSDVTVTLISIKV